MGKKSQPAAPPAPDYTGAAEKTAQSNQWAQDRADWANRPTVNTPWGSESWQSKASIDPSTGKPVTSWTQNTTLTPQSQAALDAQMALETGRSQLAGDMMGRVENDFSKPFDYSGMPARANTPQGGALNTQGGNTSGMAMQAPQGGSMTSQIGQGLSDFGSINDRAIPGMGGSVNSSVGDASRRRVEQGLLDRLRPEQARASTALETQLANKGLTPGSAAYERERERMSDSQSRQQFDALMAGGDEQQRQFNMALGSSQNDSARNQQGFGQQMQRAGLADNQRGQQFDEQARAGAFRNQAQQQRFGQGMDRAGFQNDAQQQRYAQGLSDAGFANDAQSQRFGQQMQGAAFQNQNRQAAIAEQAQQRNMSLNEMNALLSGQQIGMPDMPDFNTSQAAGGVNYNQAAQNQYNAAANNYNAGQQRNAGMMGGLTNLAGAGMMAF